MKQTEEPLQSIILKDLRSLRQRSCMKVKGRAHGNHRSLNLSDVGNDPFFLPRTTSSDHDDARSRLIDHANVLFILRRRRVPEAVRFHPRNDQRGKSASADFG